MNDKLTKTNRLISVHIFDAELISFRKWQYAMHLLVRREFRRYLRSLHAMARTAVWRKQTNDVKVKSELSLNLWAEYIFQFHCSLHDIDHRSQMNAARFFLTNISKTEIIFCYLVLVELIRIDCTNSLQLERNENENDRCWYPILLWAVHIQNYRIIRVSRRYPRNE